MQCKGHQHLRSCCAGVSGSSTKRGSGKLRLRRCDTWVLNTWAGVSSMCTGGTFGSSVAMQVERRDQQQLPLCDAGVRTSCADVMWICLYIGKQCCSRRSRSLQVSYGQNPATDRTPSCVFITNRFPVHIVSLSCRLKPPPPHRHDLPLSQLRPRCA